MVTRTVLALLLSFTNWGQLDTAGASAALRRSPEGSLLQIRTSDPAAHLSGLKMETASPALRERNKRKAVVGYYLDRGIFTRWRFIGSKGADTLEFGPQGHIITKGSGGIVDFKKDDASDRFIFTNRIDVEKCSEKHGFRCHPLNHLQRVVVKNFGKEDTIDLQGRIYRLKDVRADGTLVDVPPDRLRVEVSR